MPPNWGRMPKHLQLLCHHLVGLTWYQGETRADGEYIQKPEWQAASAFIADIAGFAWLVTAGHVFTEYEKRRAASPTFKTSWETVWDIWSPNAKVKEPPPYDFFDKDIRRYVFDDTSKGIDLAFLSISRYLGNFLCASITPFSRESWIDSDAHDYEVYYLIGTPGSLAEQETSEEGSRKRVTTYHRPTMVAIERLDPADAPIEDCPMPQFVGRIHDSFPIESVVGMSGGPILGFRHNEKGEFRYWPVAVQSRWLARKRIVIGTMLSPWLRQFEEVILDG